MTPGIFLGCTAAVMFGAVLQAATGLGAGLIVVPLLALISLKFLPAPLILASMALSSLMAWRGRAHIEGRALSTLLWGLCAGIVVGAASVSAIPSRYAGLIFGVLILIAVAISVRAPKLDRTIPISLGAGALSGFMGTVAAIGAPVVALLYQHEEGRVLRATLGFIYFVSSLVMLTLLHFAGRFGLREVLLGLWLVPAFIAGYFLATPLARRLDRGNTRIAVLVISSLSALVLILRSFL
jgi:uncharacterized protein